MRSVVFLFLVGIYFASITATAEVEFASPRQLTVFSNGQIETPPLRSTQYGAVQGSAGSQSLTNVLLSPGSVIAIRCRDGIFRDVFISGSGKLLVQLSRGSAEPSLEKSRLELRDYLLDKGMEGNPSVSRFLRHYWPERFAAPGQSQPTTTTNGLPSHDGAANTGSGSGPGRVVISAEQAPQKPLIAGPAKPKAGASASAAPAVIAGGAEPLRLNYNINYLERKQTASGVPTTKVHPSGCGSTPVSRKPLDDGRCEFGIYTAAHCIWTEADLFFSGNPRKTVFHDIVFSPHTKEEFTVAKGDIRVQFGPNWRGLERAALDPSGRTDNNRIPSSTDQALVFIKTACQRIPDNQLARFAATYGVGTGDNRVPDVYKKTTLTWLSKKTRPGSPVKVQGVLSGIVRHGDQWQISLKRSGSVDWGDSGGPIFNPKGELVGALARADDKTMSFSAVGIGWAQRTLAEEGHRFVTGSR